MTLCEAHRSGAGQQVQRGSPDGGTVTECAGGVRRRAGWGVRGGLALSWYDQAQAIQAASGGEEVLVWSALERIKGL